MGAFSCSRLSELLLLGVSPGRPRFGERRSWEREGGDGCFWEGAGGGKEAAQAGHEQSPSLLMPLCFVVRHLPKSAGSHISRGMLAPGAPLDFAGSEEALRSSGR